MSAGKRYSLVLAIILTAVILVSGCGGGGGGTIPTPTPTDTGTPGPSTSPGSFSFIETFNGVPDGTNIRPADAASRTTMLDNPDSFLYDNFGGNIWAGRTIGGTGTIGLDNGTATTQGANSQRMAFVVPGLDAVTSPVLRLRIKNDNGSGSPVASLMIYVGNSFSTSGNVGVAGQRAYGQWTITGATYTDVDIPLSTSFTSTNIIQIRPVVSGSSTGAAGIYIDRIEVTGTTGASPTPTPTGSASPTPTPTGTPVPMDSSLIGFATLNGGTNGGAGGTVVTVSTGTALQAAINAGGPRIIYVNAKITTGNSPGLSKIDVKDVSNISIFGVGSSGELEGIGIKIWKASNIIIRNLKIHHVLAPEDCIGIEGPANNIWIDHCELYNAIGDIDGDGTVGDSHDVDYYDGLLDIKDTAAFITVSWNYLHHAYKTSLIGFSDSDNYDRRITYHHNRFENCNSRLPSYRSGTGHIFNNYYYNIIDTGVNSRMGAILRVEYNHFENCKDPIGSWYSASVGYWDVYDNLFTACTGNQPTTSTGSFTPPYSYSPHMVADVKSVVQAGAGVGIIVPSSSRVKPAYRK